MKVSKALVKKAIAVEMAKRQAADDKRVADAIVRGELGKGSAVDHGSVSTQILGKPKRRAYDRNKHRGRGVS